MAALNFPSPASNGQIFIDSASGNKYTYDATRSAWRNSANSLTTTILSGNSAPASPVNGTVWWNTDLGRLFIYYTDSGNTSSWIEASPASPTIDGSIITGYINPIYNLTNASFTVANAAFGAANNVAPQVTPAFNTANAAYTQANSAYVAANTAASSGGLSPFLLMGA